MTTTIHAIGASVSFKPGPRSLADVTAKVSKHLDGGWVETTDSTGKVRKMRAGALRAA